MNRFLFEELEAIAEETIVGEPLRESLVRCLHTQLRSKLLRSGIHNAQIRIEQKGPSFLIEITFPQPKGKARLVRFQVSAL